jgi:type II secretory pathway pseudopilin PulG
MLIQWKNSKKGISIIEILVVISIITIALISIFGLIAFSLRTSTLMRETVQANNLAQETIEAVRNFRDGTNWETNGLGTLATSTVYHPGKSGDVPPKWQLIIGEETVDGFTRKVVFGQVNRDANDNIIETGGTLDSNTRKVTTTVSWRDREVKIVTYLTNWR